MAINFFETAKLREQNKRHLNCIYHQYLIKFMDVDKYLFNEFVNTRNTLGYKDAYRSAIKNMLPLKINNYFIYLKTRFEIDEESFQEILGIKEFQAIIKYPEGYSYKQKFVFILHLMLLSALDQFTDRQNHYFMKSAKGLNFSLEQIHVLQHIVNKHLSFWQSFEDTIRIEQVIYNEFANNFNIKI